MTTASGVTAIDRSRTFNVSSQDRTATIGGPLPKASSGSGSVPEGASTLVPLGNAPRVGLDHIVRALSDVAIATDA